MIGTRLTDAVPARRALKLGLTGGIGSGKSTVAKRLVLRGATLIDADAISRSITATGGAGIPAIREAFGAAMINDQGAMDRDQMRERVFQEPQTKSRLEKIVHPLVAQEIARQQILAEQGGTLCIVFDIPLLVESAHWRSKLDQVLVIDCLPETQIARVMARSGIKRAMVENILRQQASRKQRLAAADHVLFNDDRPLDALFSVVDRFADSFGL